MCVLVDLKHYGMIYTRSLFSQMKMTPSMVSEKKIYLNNLSKFKKLITFHEKYVGVNQRNINTQLEPNHENFRESK